MQKVNFAEALEKILRVDSRYDIDAYFFIREALDFTVKTLEKPEAGQKRHVSGAELMEGARLFALQEFGPMALRVLRTWGIRRTEDIGEIVFNMVNHGILGKTNEDSKEDFADGYDFEQAFGVPFRPRASLSAVREAGGDASADPPREGESTP